MDDLRLSELLCTRLCHDLIGPAGAVINGVELLADLPGNVDDEVIELIRHSALETTRRLKFFRIAMGVGVEGQSMSVCRTIADDYFAAGKISLDWSDATLDTSTPLPPGLIPIILNLVLCAAEALPRGGRVAIDGAISGDEYRLHITASGDAVKDDRGALLSLSGKQKLSNLETRGLAPYWAARQTAAAGGTIEAVWSAESITYSITMQLAY